MKAIREIHTWIIPTNMRDLDWIFNASIRQVSAYAICPAVLLRGEGNPQASPLWQPIPSARQYTSFRRKVSAKGGLDPSDPAHLTC